MGNNDSTANLAAVGAALAVLLSWVIAQLLPAAAMADFPQGPFSVLVTWAFCRYVPPSLDPMRQQPPAAGAVLAVLLAGLTSWPGCAASRPVSVADVCGPPTQAYATVQAAAIVALTSPAVHLSDSARETVQRLDRQAVAAIDACAMAARLGDLVGAQRQAALISAAAVGASAALPQER